MYLYLVADFVLCNFHFRRRKGAVEGASASLTGHVSTAERAAKLRASAKPEQAQAAVAELA